MFLHVIIHKTEHGMCYVTYPTGCLYPGHNTGKYLVLVLLRREYSLQAQKPYFQILFVST